MPTEASPVVPGADREALTAQIAEAERRLHGHLARLVPALPVPADLTIRQLQVLAILRGAPDCTAQAVAEALHVSAPTTSGLLERVVAKGWVERRPDPQDRRRALLRLTPAAEELLGEFESPTQVVREELLDGLDESELRELSRVLGRLCEVAQEKEGVHRIPENDIG